MSIQYSIQVKVVDRGPPRSVTESKSRRSLYRRSEPKRVPNCHFFARLFCKTNVDNKGKVHDQSSFQYLSPLRRSKNQRIKELRKFRSAAYNSECMVDS
jgi:hypothetical protein